MAAPEMRPRLTIRPARETDAPALREIINEAIEDGLATFACAPRSLEDQQSLITQSMADPLHPILVAEVRNWVCGSVAVEPHDPSRGLDDMGEIVIFVRRSFRSYGVGRQLMHTAQAEAARLGYRKLIGRVLADNHNSLRLCQATGWRIVGTHQQHARHGDRLRDVVVLEFVVPAASGPSGS
jgi:L-amino acid N-acyltransferase